VRQREDGLNLTMRSGLRLGKPADHVWPETGGRQSPSSSSPNFCLFEDEDEVKAKTRVSG
jgi:hypothetical protein